MNGVDQLHSGALRVAFIDVLRGVAMLLVIFHHCGAPGSNLILAFHMPLFFWLSGYVQSLQKGDVSLWATIKKRFVRLMLPYFGFELINLGISLVLYPYLLHAGNFQSVLWSIVSCVNVPIYYGICLRLWFLPCMFVVGILYALIAKVIEWRHGSVAKWSWACGLAFILLSFAVNTAMPEGRLPFALDTGLVGAGFLFIGIACRPYVDWLYVQKWYVLAAVAAMGGVGVYAAQELNSSSFLMYVDQYGDYLYSMPGALAGCFFACSLVFLCKDILPVRMVNYLSRNSLAIFPVHLDILFLVSVLLKSVDSLQLFPFPFNNFVFKVILVCVLMIPCIWVVNRFFPVLAGKGWKRRESRQ